MKNIKIKDYLGNWTLTWDVFKLWTRHWLYKSFFIEL